jgi:ArsR family transcriptional regulator
MSSMKRLIDPDALLLQGAADPTRLAILRQLATGDGVCACDFTSCCDVAQPTVSHHLKVLRESGWVRTERRGSNVWYWLRPEALDRFGRIAGELTPRAPVRPARALPVIEPAPWAAWASEPRASGPRTTRETPSS